MDRFTYNIYYNNKTLYLIKLVVKRRRFIYTLYWDRGGANMATHAILEALGVPYKLIEIDLTKKMQKTPEYLAINPNGKVPTLQHNEQVIYESSAILMYILDQHPESGLAPALNSPKRGYYYQYLIWMSNTLQEAVDRWAHPENYISDDASLEQIKDKGNQILASCWDILNTDLGKKGPWLLGDELSGADFHLFMITYWSHEYESRAEDWPHLRSHIQAMLKLDSIQKMMAQEGLSFER